MPLSVRQMARRCKRLSIRDAITSVRVFDNGSRPNRRALHKRLIKYMKAYHLAARYDSEFANQVRTRAFGFMSQGQYNKLLQK